MDNRNDLQAPVWLACLCAAWCGTCDGYLPVLQSVSAEFEAALPRLQVCWIDIEDEAELVGEYDVETFPTLAVFDSMQVRFLGPLTPQPETLRRLLRATLLEWVPGSRSHHVAAETDALATRLRERSQAKALQRSSGLAEAGAGGVAR